MRHRTWLFDCDGVILDSNRVKSEAMSQVTAHYGPAISEVFVAYHQSHAGVSRYAKFDHLFAEILCRPPAPGERERLLNGFGSLSAAGLANAPADPAFVDVLMAIGETGGEAFVVSGGDQDELRSIFRDRGWDVYFSGIYGSPTPKREIVREVMIAARRPAVMIGDSELDYQVAAEHGLDFVFVSHWTEMEGWHEAFAARSVKVIEDLAGLKPWFEASHA